MRAHAQAMNEYRGGEMSTEVVVDGSESVLRAWLRGRTFDFLVHGSRTRLVLIFSPLRLFFFPFLFFF